MLQMPGAPDIEDWFQRGLSMPGTSRFVDDRNVRLHYLSWSTAETQPKPGLLFVHGFLGHARWWDFIAPWFCDRYRVAALDLSGMGDSGMRTAYGVDAWADDIAQVICDAGIAPAVLIGHSFGGARALDTASRYPHLVSLAVTLDSYLHFSDLRDPRPSPNQRRVNTIYTDYASARARFRLTPPQTALHPIALEHVAHHSIKQVDTGWTWKFDAAVPAIRDLRNAADWLGLVECPVAVIRAELSGTLRSQHADRMMPHLRHGTGPIVIPDANHHIMLDQPVALVATLRNTLACLTGSIQQ